MFSQRKNNVSLPFMRVYVNSRVYRSGLTPRNAKSNMFDRFWGDFSVVTVLSQLCHSWTDNFPHISNVYPPPLVYLNFENGWGKKIESPLMGGG